MMEDRAAMRSFAAAAQARSPRFNIKFADLKRLAPRVFLATILGKASRRRNSGIGRLQCGNRQVIFGRKAI
jgi:hypothetical protein